MNNEWVTPSPDADEYEWCRWAWLVGRRVNAKLLGQLHELASDMERDPLIRQTALGSYWMIAEVDDAIALEEKPLEQKPRALAVHGLNHPRWWHDSR